MNALFLGEFLGTMVLIVLGGGVVAGVLLAKSKAHGAGWIVITAGWAFAVTLGILTAKAFGAPGALNPVGPLADLTLDTIPLRDALAMIAGEFLGAMLGAALVWLHYLPHWRETNDPGLKLAVFCTAPAIRSTYSNLFSEVFGTFMLVFLALAVSKASLGALGPSLVGVVVWAIGLSLGGTTGYAINPARDLGPRLMHAILPIAGKGSSDWGYAWIPVLGPCLGGVLAAFMFKMLQ